MIILPAGRNVEIEGLGSLTGPVLEELRKGELLARRLARRVQRDAARLGGERKRTKTANPFMQVPPESFHYWGQRLGYECWDDAQFVREFLRDNPDCRVRTQPLRPTLGYTPRKVRYHKSFGELKGVAQG